MMRRAPFVVLGLTLAFGSRADAAVFSCDEPGVLAAIAAGGGPHTFSCAGPTTIVTSAELVIAQSVELDGGGLLTLSGGHAHRVINIPLDPGIIVVSLLNLAAIDGVAPEISPGQLGPGGCIATREKLTLVNVEVSGCEAGGGGGLSSQSAALTVVDSRIHGNRARSSGGGGIYANGQLTLTRTSIRDNRANNFRGGGLHLDQAHSSITESTISANDALRGGAIYAYSVLEAQSPVSIARSTIAHNTDESGALVVDGADVEIEDSTFAGNLPVAVRVPQGQHAYTDTNNLRIRSSTLIGNSGTQPSTIQVDPALPPSPGRDGEFYATVVSTILIPGGSGTVVSEGGNIFVTQGTCDPTDQCVSKDDLNLGKLGPNGGPTWTVPLRAPSVAIDSAPGCLSVTDQRGVARPFGAACDVGAFEWDGPAPGEVPALPWLGVAALFAALCAAGLWSLRGRRSA